MNKHSLIVLTFVLFCGCHSVDVSKLSLAKQSANSCVHVYVTDQRPYILSGDKSPDFIGIVRGGYGNPFDFSSSSGNSLAKDLGVAIQQAITTSSTAKFMDGAFVPINSERCKTVVLSYTEWKIDSFINAWFMYDAEVSVYSQSGKVLAKNAATDKRVVSGSFWNPLGAARRNFLQETTSVINTLLTDVKVASALMK